MSAVVSDIKKEEDFYWKLSLNHGSMNLFAHRLVDIELRRLTDNDIVSMWSAPPECHQDVESAWEEELREFHEGFDFFEEVKSILGDNPEKVIKKTVLRLYQQFVDEVHGEF